MCYSISHFSGAVSEYFRTLRTVYVPDSYPIKIDSKVLIALILLIGEKVVFQWEVFVIRSEYLMNEYIIIEILILNHKRLNFIHTLNLAWFSHELSISRVSGLNAFGELARITNKILFILWLPRNLLRKIFLISYCFNHAR